MAYNPDEIAKVKHLNEFARQLRIKLDGETDPKPQRVFYNIKCVCSSGSPTIINPTLVDGVYTVSITTAQITQKFITFSFNSYSISSLVGQIPYWVPSNNNTFGNYTTWGGRGSGSAENNTSVRVTFYDNTVAQIVEGSVVFDEDENFARTEIKFKAIVEEA
ncbi:MAG: hypothetical protein IKI76_03980 [Selenomonadaceae bacterium]|nr:hypothetical protein [Selenomonadaceae bacterium]